MKVQQVNITDKTFVKDEEGNTWTPFGREGSEGRYVCLLCGYNTTQGWLNIDTLQVICDKHIEIERSNDYVVMVRHISSYPAWVTASSKDEAARIVKDGVYVQLEETTIEDNCDEAWEVWEGEEIPEQFKATIKAARRGNIDFGMSLEEFTRVEE